LQAYDNIQDKDSKVQDQEQSQEYIQERNLALESKDKVQQSALLDNILASKYHNDQYIQQPKFYSPSNILPVEYTGRMKAKEQTIRVAKDTLTSEDSL
jgi:hypothetical protein